MGVLKSCLNILTGFAKSELGKDYRFGAPDSFMRVGSIDVARSNQRKFEKFSPQFADTFELNPFHSVAMFKHGVNKIDFSQISFVLSNLAKSFVSRLINNISLNKTSCANTDLARKDQLYSFTLICLMSEMLLSKTTFALLRLFANNLGRNDKNPIIKAFDVTKNLG